MTNADVAAVTGLHETYALSLFTSVMRMPMRRFIIRMRLMRARALLTEGNATVASVALRGGLPVPVAVPRPLPPRLRHHAPGAPRGAAAA